ncbi:MAG: 4-alpha-glucanotransferase [Candidatus Rokuibacteriota bacterium]
MPTDAWGITSGYHDTLGVWRPTPAHTRAAILEAMGADPAGAPAGDPPPVAVATPGGPLPAPGRFELRLEDGRVLDVEGRVPDDLPLGYHRLRRPGTGPGTLLLAAPGCCPAPPTRSWGWAAQLYAARSAQSWGIGDLADLARLGRFTASHGGSLVLVNPLCAPLPLVPQPASPYRASSRRFRSPLYLRVEDVPGARDLAVELEPLARAGRALDDERRIDRDAVHRLKEEALRRLHARFGGDPRFEAYRREQGVALRDFATFSALAEHHGAGWSRWPTEHRRPDAPGVAAFRRARAERVRFHEWVQWLLDEQFARASSACPVMLDLPIGFDPDGADAWAWQDVLALGANVGAPPDRYNATGQDWELPPFVPHRLRAAGYAPFVETIRATLRHAGALRIDHVMGLFRLFWIPPGLTPADGAYVRYLAGELLAIVALEAARAGAWVVGEDLGTVEEGVRETLAERRVLSYRCLWFEEDPPARYPALSLGSVTTHDLPTIAGLWTGADVEDQRKIGLTPNADGIDAIRRRLAGLIGLPLGAPVPAVIERTHAALASAGSCVVAATLEDALAVSERPNMPGTTGQWPNWSLALPAPIEHLEQDPLALGVARVLARR